MKTMRPEAKPAARHRAVALTLMSLGLALTLALTTFSIRVTYVTDSNGASQLLLTSESDPTRLMSLSGIEAAEGDRVYYTAFGDSLATLNIERAFTVTVEADGEELPVKMVFGTVADALEKAGVTLGPDDYTVPAQDSLVGIGSRIEVHRVRYEETVEYQTIPYETEYIYTSLYFRDTDRVTTLQAGADTAGWTASWKTASSPTSPPPSSRRTPWSKPMARARRSPPSPGRTAPPTRPPATAVC